MANDQVIFETTTYLVRFTAKWTLPTFAVVPDLVYPHQLFLFESRFVITKEASIFFSVFKFGAWDNKGQLISKWLFGVFNFFKKTKKPRRIVVEMNSFVRFLEEFKA